MEDEESRRRKIKRYERKLNRLKKLPEDQAQPGPSQSSLGESDDNITDETGA